jgi:Ca2+ transporting ATPase
MSLQRLCKEFHGPLGLVRALHTNLKTGIEGSPGDINRRREVFGCNTKRIPKIRNLLELIKEAISDRTLIFLLILGLINIIIQTAQNPSMGWVDGITIFGAVFMIVVIQAQNNWSKEK